MKKTYFLLTLLLSYSVFAQLATPDGKIQTTVNSITGNVGIGTNDPKTKLDVNGELTISRSSPINIGGYDPYHGLKYSYSDFAKNFVYGPVLYGWSGGALGIKKEGGESIALKWNPKEVYVNGELTISRSSPINIGGNDPYHGLKYSYSDFAKSFVDGPVLYGWSGGALGIKKEDGESIALKWNPKEVYVNGELTISRSSPINIGGNDPYHGLKYSYSDFAKSFVDGPILYGWSGGALGIKKEGGESIALRWNQNGNVSVSNKLEAKEVKVTETPTADFVFEEDYALPTLQEVEQHIKEKKHLPEIASAKQMEKDGVNIGEFQIQLLQKIEELTLYIIEQDKRIKELEKNKNN